MLTRTPAAAGPDDTQFARRVALLALGSFSLGLDAYVMAGLLPSITTEFSVTLPIAGQVVTVFTVCYAVAAPLFATLLPGIRVSVVLGIALTVFSAGNAASAMATSLPLLLAARAIAGMGAGLYSPFAAAAAAALAPPHRRGRSLAIVLGGMSLGTVLGVPAGLLLADRAGWRATMVLVTLLGLFALAGVVWKLPDIAASPPPSARQRLKGLRDARVATIIGVSFLAAVSSLGLYTYLVPILAVAGRGGREMPYLLAWGTGGVIGSFSIGWVLDRVGRPFTLVAVIMATITISMLLLAWLRGTDWLLLLPLTAWGAAGWSLQVPQQHELLASRPDLGPVTVALNGSALYLGSAIGAALGGLALFEGLDIGSLPLCAAAVAAAGLLLHCLAVRRRSAFWP